MTNKEQTEVDEKVKSYLNRARNLCENRDKFLAPEHIEIAKMIQLEEHNNKNL